MVGSAGAMALSLLVGQRGWDVEVEVGHVCGMTKGVEGSVVSQ